MAALTDVGRAGEVDVVGQQLVDDDDRVDRRPCVSPDVGDRSFQSGDTARARGGPAGLWDLR